MQKYIYALLLLFLPMTVLAAPEQKPEVAAFFSGQFPMIMYAIPATDANFKAAKSMGIDYVHLYGLSERTADAAAFERVQNYLDLAHQHGLKVMFDLDGGGKVPQDALEDMRSVVRRFKDHPALGFWYLFDEPDNHNVTVTQMEPFYAMLKEETPQIPVAVCHAWTKNWTRYTGVQDILIHDTYPVTGIPFPDASLNTQTLFTEGSLRFSNYSIPALQFFNWRSYAKPGQTELRNSPVSELRYPNAEEIRYLNYSTIAQGVRGLAYFSYLRSMTPDATWVTHTATPALREVREFTNIIKNGFEFQRFRDVDKDQLIFSVWNKLDKNYIVLVNASSQKRSVSLEREVLSGKNWKAWGKTRAEGINISGKTITITEIKPWEVLIWENS